MRECAGLEANTCDLKLKLVQERDDVLNIRGKLCFRNKLTFFIDDTNVDRSQ